MKKAITVFSVILAAFGLSNGRTQDLPRGAQELANKLQEWEAAEKEKLKQRIQEKRTQVEAALQAHLARVTRNGDLDGALAIRAYLKSLNDSKESDKRVTPEETRELLIGTLWKMSSEKGKMTLTFISETEAVWTHDNFKGVRVWRIVKDGEIELAPNTDMLKKDIRFTFDLERGAAHILLRRLGPNGFEIDAKLEQQQ